MGFDPRSDNGRIRKRLFEITDRDLELKSAEVRLNVIGFVTDP